MQKYRLPRVRPGTQIHTPLGWVETAEDGVALTPEKADALRKMGYTLDPVVEPKRPLAAPCDDEDQPEDLEDHVGEPEGEELEEIDAIGEAESRTDAESLEENQAANMAVAEARERAENAVAQHQAEAKAQLSPAAVADETGVTDRRSRRAR